MVWVFVPCDEGIVSMQKKKDTACLVMWLKWQHYIIWSYPILGVIMEKVRTPSEQVTHLKNVKYADSNVILNLGRQVSS